MKPLAFLFVILACSTCTAWARDDASAQKVGSPDSADHDFFEKRVRPLLFNRCYECHSAQAKTLRGALLLDNPSGILAGGSRGPAIVPGKPEQSLLIQAVSYENEDLRMPPGGKLPEQEIALLVQWIQRGAALPAASAPTPLDFTEARKFWSFQPLQTHEPQAVRHPEWLQTRIDAFVLAQLDQRNLTPSATADRRTLIRRATFDLIGLPPTPEEVDAFLNDARPEAYAFLIDRLLASAHYGERWARFWLDLVRYADTTDAFLRSLDYAYLYRDWVVRAFNNDMPYDQFVKRQLASDLMSQTSPEDLPALGLLGLSPTYWKELKLDKEVIKVIVADEWEERIDAVSSTLLGLTVACARCHDHKFDPITTQDYYALAGVFASTRLIDRPLIPEPEAMLAQQAHELVQSLKQKIEKLGEQKPVPPESEKQIADLKALIAHVEQSTPHYHTPRAHAVDDASLFVLSDGPDHTKLEYQPGVPRDLALHLRGNPSNLGPVVPRRFLAVLSVQAPQPFQQGSGRLELAHAIVTQAAPLSARVIVNRIWRQHFGRGLVTTPSNFGAQGARPSHPELLDDLAARFIDHGWSIKWLHRELMLSATYQQLSAYDGAKDGTDPENRWLWRMNRRRLDVEAWRDAMLAVAGNLDAQISGPHQDLKSLENRRRTLYGTVARRDLDDLLRLYDFPDPNSHSPGREITTTPLQQLLVLNSPLMLQQAAALVERLRKEQAADISAANALEAQIQRAYFLLFTRPASPKELSLAVDFLTAASEDHSATEDRWRQYAQVLLGSNEFMFID